MQTELRDTREALIEAGEALLAERERSLPVIQRGVFLKGSGMLALWREALILAAFGVGVLTLASIESRRSLD